MMKLLSTEWLKIKQYRTFWVLLGLFMLLLPLWMYGISSGFLKPGGGKKGTEGIIGTGYGFPDVWDNVGYWSSVFVLFISIIIIILTTNEYGYRTNRQNIIDGWTKMEFYHAKVLMIFVLSLFATTYFVLLAAIFGRLNTGSFTGFFNGFYKAGYFFLLSLDYLGFGLAIAIIIKKSGLAIGLFLLYSMFIETLLKFFINHHLDKPYGNLLPLQASDELLPFPLGPMAKMMMGASPTLPMVTYTMVAMAWCLIYYFAGRAILLRNDW